MAKNQNNQGAESEGVGLVSGEAGSSPESNSDWYQNEAGDWCFGAACFSVRVPGAGGEVEFTFEPECPDDVVDAIYLSGRRGTVYNLKPSKKQSEA